jgi:exodeoxyribonuclease V alpha subunit
MIDVECAAAYLAAVPSGARLVVVGDQDQLPPVGPGAFFRDLLATRPHAELVEVKRAAGTVLRACRSIRAGKMPRPDHTLDLDAGCNWVHRPCPDPEGTAALVCATFAAYVRSGRQPKAHPPWSNIDPFWDIQVITSQREKLPFSCNKLNPRLAGSLNPRSDGSGRVGVGDKVIRRKNDWVDGLEPAGAGTRDAVVVLGSPHRISPVYVVNGDMGVVLESVRVGAVARLVVRFRNPDRLCLLAGKGSHLEPAYAITTHLAQGSQWPVVIVPLSADFYWDKKSAQGLWCRELVYTAFSRPQGWLVTVGKLDSLGTALPRRTVRSRYTYLSKMIEGGPPGLEDTLQDPGAGLGPGTRQLPPGLPG